MLSPLFLTGLNERVAGTEEVDAIDERDLVVMRILESGRLHFRSIPDVSRIEDKERVTARGMQGMRD